MIFAKKNIERLEFKVWPSADDFWQKFGFLSSYIHDATFALGDIKLARQSGILTIKIDRDCWELRDVPKSGNLPKTKSLLKIFYVDSLQLIFDDAAHFISGLGIGRSIFVITSIYFDSYNDTLVFSDSAYHQRLTIRYKDVYPGLPVIELRDLSTAPRK